MNFIITTSEKLDIALKRQGLKRKDLAERLGISQPTLSKKFKYNDWRESDIKKICKIDLFNFIILFSMICYDIYFFSKAK